MESSLPAETIQAWQRSAMSGYGDEHTVKPVDERLKSLMKFLRSEVRGAERLSYVTEGFGELNSENVTRSHGKIDKHAVKALPTAAGLFGGQTKSFCIFCDNKHDSEKCVTAQSMPYQLKKRKILEKKACLSCLKIGHVTKSCKSYIKCLLCQNKHVPLMCPDLDVNKGVAESKPKLPSEERTNAVHSQLNCTNEVLLQTLHQRTG